MDTDADLLDPNGTPLPPTSENSVDLTAQPHFNDVLEKNFRNVYFIYVP